MMPLTFADLNKEMIIKKSVAMPRLRLTLQTLDLLLVEQ